MKGDGGWLTATGLDDISSDCARVPRESISLLRVGVVAPPRMFVCRRGLGDPGSIVGPDSTPPCEACFAFGGLDCLRVSREVRRAGPVLCNKSLDKSSVGSFGVSADILTFCCGRGAPRPDACLVARGATTSVGELAGFELPETSFGPPLALESGGGCMATELPDNPAFPFVSTPYRRRLRRMARSRSSSSDDGRS